MTNPDLEHRYRGQLIVESFASSQQEVPRPSLQCFNLVSDIPIGIELSHKTTYQKLTSVLVGLRQVCKHRQSCHRRPKQGIVHWARTERCELFQSDCSWKQVVLVCSRILGFRYCKWPPSTKCVRIHLTRETHCQSVIQELEAVLARLCPVDRSPALLAFMA